MTKPTDAFIRAVTKRFPTKTFRFWREGFICYADADVFIVTRNTRTPYIPIWRVLLKDNDGREDGGGGMGIRLNDAAQASVGSLGIRAWQLGIPKRRLAFQLGILPTDPTLNETPNVRRNQ